MTGVRFPTDAPNYCLHSDIITYSIPQFITIRRIMVSNLVSNNRLGACAEACTGIAYMSLTRDWYYEFVKWL